MYRIITCDRCHSQNSEYELFCKECNTPLWSKGYIIEKLLKRQQEIEESYSRDIRNLKEQLIFLQQTIKNEEPVEEKFVADQPQEVEEINDLVEIEIAEKENIPNKKEVLDEVFFSEPAAVKAPPVERAPSELEKWLTQFLEPFFDGISLLGKVYHKYKVEGKLPIFFMTVAGIVAILFGFGYLMQYTFQYMGPYAEIVKIGLGFAASFSIGAFGIKLSLRDENSREYGSALISLAIILNYLFIYFLSDLGNFPLLSSAIVGFILIIINTATAVVLAVKFETRVVSVLSLVGGALAPFYLNSTSDGSLYYMYLWLLLLASNVVSYSIKWEALKYLSFAVGFALLQAVVFQYSPSSILFTIYYHLYAYLFFYFILFEKLKIKERLEKTDIALLAANLGIFLYNLFDVNDGSMVHLGLMYLANASAFVYLLFHFWAKLSQKIRLTFFIVIGSLAGFAIPSLFNQALMGLFWSIEGMILVVLGFNFSMRRVRQEGYIVLLMALAKMMISSMAIILDWGEALWHEGFLNFVVIGILATGLWYTGEKFKNLLTDLEKRLIYLTKEFVPVWLSIIFLLVSYEFVGIWSLNLAIVPIFGLVLWGKKFSTNYSGTVAYIHFLLLLLSFVFSTQKVVSYHFSDQKLYAKIALLECMAGFWFMKKYHEWLKIDKLQSFEFAKILRIVFYLILPITVISSTRRHAIEYIEPAMWLSFLISYFLYKKLKYQAVFIESILLVVAAIIVSFSGFDGLGFIAGVVAIIVLSFVEGPHNKKRLSSSPYKIPLMVLPYFAIAFTALSYSTFFKEDIFLSTSIFSFLVFVLMLLKDKLAFVKSTFRWGIKIGSVSNFIALAGVVFNSEGPVIFSIISLIIFGYILVNRHNWYLLKKEKPRWIVAFLFHQVSTIVTYLLFLDMIGIDTEGPLVSVILVLHAITLLFLSLKTGVKIFNQLSVVLFVIALLKVVFHDIRDFSSVQKVIVLIVLGILLLGASYVYLKLKPSFKKAFEKDTDA